MRSLPLRVMLVVILVTSPILAGCGKSDLSKLHDALNKTAKSLNAAAKTNRAFYDAGIYGVPGSESAIDVRQKAAKAVHAANEKLILALKLAQNLTAETFEEGKLAVLQALAAAAGGLSTGNQKIDLVLQGVIALINQAVILIQGFQSHHLPYVLPEIRTWRLGGLTA